MARYDVYPGASGKGHLLDCQSDLLSDLTTRVVIPLMPVGTELKASRLNPAFDVEGESHVLATHLIFAIPRARLAAPIANFGDQHDVILRAIDMLVTGV